jgi:hypothetical protein
MAKILFRLPFVVKIPEQPDLTTYDEAHARAALPPEERGKPLRRIGVYIPALEGYGLPTFVDGQIETDNPAVVILLIGSGSGFRWDRAAAQALLHPADAQAEPVVVEPPKPVTPDFDLMTKDELADWALDNGIGLDRRKHRDAMLKELRKELAKK